MGSTRQRLARILWISLLALGISALLCFSLGIMAMSQSQLTVTGSHSADLVLFEYTGGEIAIGFMVITLVSLPVNRQITRAAACSLVLWIFLFSATVPA